MGLSREERQALDEIEERLAFDDPDLDALLSGSLPERRREVPAAVWWTIAIVAYVVFLIGVVMTVATPEDACRGTSDGRCQPPPARTTQTVHGQPLPPAAGLTGEPARSRDRGTS
ncbi:DUF3040 domain-containing protein [Nonomuraea sp. CA-218870]|uniref:DUF3040 domain-containing protein n=1 Tax=Nonomuraea sp. CA-218870 TaxID=3239998 RepID=UPI003D8DB07C